MKNKKEIIEKKGGRKRGVIRIIFVVAMILFLVGCVSATDYYVDATNGNDVNDGLSDATAWKTIAKVNLMSFNSEDNIKFKRGETWNERLIFPSSGAPGNPITLGAYGSGALPKFTHYFTVTSWTDEGGGVYSAASGHTYTFFEDGNFLTNYDENIPNSPGEWWYDTNVSKIYYYPSSGTPADHVLWKVITLCIIEVVDCDYINIENLNVEHGFNAVCVSGSSDHINIDSCDINHCGRTGVSFSSAGYCSVTNCELSYFGDSGVYFIQNPGNYNLIANNNISYCNYGGWTVRDGHGIGLQATNYNIVRDNIISHCGSAALSIGGGYGANADYNIITDNIFSSGKKIYPRSYWGVAIGIHNNNDDNQANYNLFYQNVINIFNTGYKPQGATIKNKFFHNTLYNCGSATGWSSAVYMKNSENYELKNNIFTNSDTWQIRQENTVGNNNLFDYNCYSPDILNGWIYRGITLINFAAWQAANPTYNDLNSFIANPLLSNPGDNDFTLQSGSPAIDTGIWLTTITSPTNTGQTTFTVADASYFHDGFGIIDINNIMEIGSKIKTENGQTTTIQSINYDTNTITVSPAINIVNSEGLSLNYEGSSPDIGAYEYIGEIVSTCGLADTDTDGFVSINEVINYITGWKAGNVNIADLINGITEWKNGC